MNKIGGRGKEKRPLGLAGRNRMRRAGQHLATYVCLHAYFVLYIHALLILNTISLCTAASILTFLHPLIINTSDAFYVILENPALLVSA